MAASSPSSILHRDVARKLPHLSSINFLQSPRNWGLCLDITILVCLLACPSPPKRLRDFIINEIKEEGMIERWNDGMTECMNV
jgi:hypothetical protein